MHDPSNVNAFDAIVAGSHLRFDGVRQRPQHLLSRLARRAAVLFVEEPFAASDDGEQWSNEGELTVLRPLRRAPRYDVVDARTLDAVRAWCRERAPLVWLYTPQMLALADALPGRPLVYDCMDDLAAFEFAAADMRAREAILLDRSALVFAGGRSLYEARRSAGPKVRLYPSGVDFAFFAAAGALPPHPLLVPLPGPVYGYFGVIDERIDYAIVAALGAAADVVMIGPFAKIDLGILPQSPRIHYTGHVPYALLPSFLAGFDVAVMPFANVAATRSISPTKTPEYLAGGKPVVSTRVADVVATYGSVVHFADTPAEFVRACETARHDAAAARRRGAERARAVSWDALAEAMWRDLCELPGEPL